MDSIEITIIRTGAATAVAAKYLSRADSEVALICGCGNQGKISLKAISEVRQLKKIYAYDIDVEVVMHLLRNSVGKKHRDSHATDFVEAAQESDIIVTCTPARKYFLKEAHVSPERLSRLSDLTMKKNRKSIRLLIKSNKLIDSIDQCATIGELHHAIELGVMKKTDVHAKLGQILWLKKWKGVGR